MAASAASIASATTSAAADVVVVVDASATGASMAATSAASAAAGAVAWAAAAAAAVAALAGTAAAAAATAASATAAAASDASDAGGVLSCVGPSHFRLRDCTVAPGIAAAPSLSGPCCKRCGEIKTGKGSSSCSALSLLARDAVDSTPRERRGELATAAASARDFCDVALLRGARPGLANRSLCRRML